MITNFLLDWIRLYVHATLSYEYIDNISAVSYNITFAYEAQKLR
jgi:hypothetical protein